MSVNNIPKIEVNGTGIPLIRVDNAGIEFIGSRRIGNTNIQRVGVNNISDARIWLIEPSQAIPIVVPVTERVGTPIVDMPGCVKVHKENNTRQNNKNKCLWMMTLKEIWYYVMLVLHTMNHLIMIIENYLGKLLLKNNHKQME